MTRRLAWLLVLDAAVAVLLARRFVTLQDQWERQAHALAIHENLGAP